MPDFDAPQSRNEAILQNMMGANNVIKPPMSRIEVLLIELLEYLQQGGGDVTAAAVLSAIGDMTSAQAAQALDDLGGEPERFVVNVTENSGTFSADKTLAEIVAAYASGKAVVAKYNGLDFVAVSVNELVGSAIFVAVQNRISGDVSTIHQLYVYDDRGSVWEHTVINLEQMTATVTVSTQTADITPIANTIYKCGGLTSLTITDPPVTGEYTIVFSSGATATTTTIPSSILGLESFAPEVNTVYEINVLDNRAVIGKWAVSA